MSAEPINIATVSAVSYGRSPAPVGMTLEAYWADPGAQARWLPPIDATANKIIQQNSSKLAYGADPTAQAGFGATPNPALIARMTEYQQNQNWMYAMLLGGLVIWYVATR